jgi:hypothetical protein
MGRSTVGGDNGKNGKWSKEEAKSAMKNSRRIKTRDPETLFQSLVICRIGHFIVVKSTKMVILAIEEMEEAQPQGRQQKTSGRCWNPNRMPFEWRRISGERIKGQWDGTAATKNGWTQWKGHQQRGN